ncbi:MAG: hypothetical protein FWC33_03555 [Candidatus Bathyarchaeota archaeon]|nr:hypothetical protein [Candidatus Termiticorpusculum sp.]
MGITKEQDLLIQHLAVNLVNMLIEEQKKSIEQALNIVYNSTAFEKICDVKTGLYRESAGYNYDILQDELKHGKFGQYGKYE